ncbi:MAG TPA: hypothetical protein VMU15_09080 [Anaeromyxobacter sp.]|nr:hypothetical protein [Anaeromyxobacter sp.]
MRVLPSKLLPLALAVPLLAAGRASAAPDVRVHIRLGLPAQPHLAVVGPGIQVVEGFPDAEVFYSGGWYWCRRQDGWYRSHSAREDFYRVDRDRVPPSLLRLPAGRYRDWHPGEGRREERLEHERHEERERHEHEERPQG